METYQTLTEPPLQDKGRSGLVTFLVRELSDARYFQILYQTAFLLYGIMHLGWSSDLMRFGAIFGTCIAVQCIGAWLTHKPLSSVKSAIITGLGLCLLMQANSIWTLVLAAALAIGSKFIIRIKGKHLFNPTNFGLILCLLLTDDCWISPGQWGREAMLLFFLGAAGLMIIFKVGRVDTSLGFLLTFAFLEYLRMVAYQGWEAEVWLHKMMNGSVLLFTFFMITDPVTTPNNWKARLIWSAMVGALTFYLGSFMFVHTAPVWALFIISPFTALFDKFLSAKNRFQWIKA